MEAQMLLSLTLPPPNELNAFIVKTALLAIWLWIIFSFVSRFQKRNNAVYKYKVDLINRVGALARADALSGREWRWRYKRMDEVKYFTLLFHYTVPLRDEYIYKDLSFLDPKA